MSILHRIPQGVAGVLVEFWTCGLEGEISHWGFVIVSPLDHHVQVSTASIKNTIFPGQLLNHRPSAHCRRIRILADHPKASPMAMGYDWKCF